MNRFFSIHRQLKAPHTGALLLRAGTIRSVLALTLTVLLIGMLSACQAAPAQTEETAPPAAVAAPAAAPSPAAQETEAPPEIMEPVETEAPTETEEPKPSELAEDFFDDALFIGDSLTGSLRSYLMQNGGLGTAKLIFVNGLACHNIVLKNQTVVFMGKACSPAEAASMAGAKKLYLLLAANDVGTRTVEELRSCWDSMIADIQEANPDITIYVQSGTPFRGDVNYFTKENMDEYNEMLRKMCEETGCVYVDITGGLLTEEGYLDDSFRVDIEDNVHMNQKGCAIWVRNLRNPDSYSISPLD